MVDGHVALHCAECGWMLAGLPGEQARDVPRCLACGHASLVVVPVPTAARAIRWPKPDDWPGWAVYSRPVLDRGLLAAESLN